MRSTWLPALLAGIPLVASTLVLPDPTPIPTTTSAATAPTCVADDLLRLLRVNGRKARPFCRGFLGLESTSIVVTVTPPAVTTVVTETITTNHLETPTITNVETILTTVIETVVVETQTITSTSVATIITAARARRLRRDALSAINDYPLASISSACSCLNDKMCGKKATATLPAATATSMAGTVTVDPTEIKTVTEVATTTVVTTVTSEITATSVVVVTPRPTTFPTGPFRLVSKNAKGEKIYFQRWKWGSDGDMLYSTKNATGSVIFTLDAQRRLSFSSPDYPAPVFSYMANDWFPVDVSVGYIFLSNTEANLSNPPARTIYQFNVDWETLAIVPFNTPAPVIMFLCNQVINKVTEAMLVIGKVDVISACTWATIHMEFD
ncbi:hypothetical protein N0V88_004968 [Collariella sp. IMI 366227]|nr:hypothetical protein N0V88_004968 [Collariella sp. IMI 366227]